MKQKAGATSDALRKDFRLFLYVVWSHLGLPDPTPVQYEIAFYLQHGPSRSMISAFRGVGKSWITSAYVLWLLYCDPQLNILVVSASKQRADNFSTFTLRLIAEMEILAFLRPRDDQRQSKIEFDVAPARAAHAASVRSAGITGQITGSRADVIVADDIEVPNNSNTQGARDKLAETVKEFDSILKPRDEATQNSPLRILFLGTPQSEQTVYLELANRGYDVRIWPARYPTPKQRIGYGSRLAPSISKKLLDNPALGTKYGDMGEVVDPKRFTNEDLMAREASIGRSTFALQFMLDTTLADTDRYPLKLKDLVVMPLNARVAPVELTWGAARDLAIEDLINQGFNGDLLHKPFFVSQEHQKYAATIMTIDPSGRGQDEVGYAVVAFSYGRLFLLDAGGLQGGYEDVNLEFLANLAKEWGVNKVVTEQNFGDGMFDRLLQPILNRIHPECGIEPAERSNAQKEARIVDTLEPIMNQHKLIVNKDLLNKDFNSTLRYPLEKQAQYRLFYQMTRMTRERGALRHDDRIDALALAVHYWTERMSQDQDKAMDRHKAQALREEIKKFKSASFLAGAPKATANRSALGRHGHRTGNRAVSSKGRGR